MWDQADGTGVEIDLIQFRDSEGAARFFNWFGYPEHITNVAGTHNGFVGQYTGTDRSGMYLATGLVQHGNVVEVVFMNRAQSVPTMDEAMKVTKDQADRL